MRKHPNMIIRAVMVLHDNAQPMQSAMSWICCTHCTISIKHSLSGIYPPTLQWHSYEAHFSSRTVSSKRCGYISVYINEMSASTPLQTYFNSFYSLAQNKLKTGFIRTSLIFQFKVHHHFSHNKYVLHKYLYFSSISQKKERYVTTGNSQL
jgi:hypothetical protein